MAGRRTAPSADLPGEPGPDDLRLDRQLCFALYAASRAVVRAYGPLLDEHGITYPQYVVLLALWGDRDRVWTVGELGHEVRIDGGTLTPLLKRLERDGWVVRRRDPADERRVVIAVTPEGWELRDRVVGVPRSLAGRLGLSLEEGIRLKRTLETLVEVLGETGSAGPADGLQRGRR